MDTKMATPLTIFKATTISTTTTMPATAAATAGAAPTKTPPGAASIKRYRKQIRDVEFQDVCYNVTERKNFFTISGTRQILRNVSGSFRNGQLSAIMGPSGAGKSSLLNAISGYITSGVSGHMEINRKNSCYITQDDNHQNLLTVEELMRLACQLRVKQKYKHDEVITEILENLNLQNCRNITAFKLSGGERKRLSIALELVANPNIFFLDEPTSGLDEVTAAQCIRMLSFLAKQGRTIVCTIHQPSASIFNSFDSIFVLAKGECVYQGGPNALLPFLRHAKLPCPLYYNPSDYIIELCDADDGKLIPLLSDLTENGKLIYTPHICNNNTATPTHNTTPTDDCSKIYEFRPAVTTFFMETIDTMSTQKSHGKQAAPRKQFLATAGSVPSTDGSLLGGASAIIEHMKVYSKRLSAKRQHKISGFRQFCVLMRFMMLKIMRARIALFIQFMHHLLCGLFFGLIFLNLGNEGSRMFDHLKFCVGAILVVVYTQVMVPVLNIPMEVKIVKKETFNRWYRLVPYYMALTISRLPLQIFLNIIFMVPTYFMTGLPYQWWRFALFVAVILMTSLVAEGMGLAIGATFSITNGSVVGPLIIAPLMGLAIYGFDFAAQIPSAVTLMMKLSYIRVGVVGLVLTVFGFDRDELDCSEIYCHFSDPRVLLKFLDIENVSLLQVFSLLAGLLLFFRTLLYLTLRRRCGT